MTEQKPQYRHGGKRKNAGRPPLGKSKTIKIEVKLTEEELAILEECSPKYGGNGPKAGQPNRSAGVRALIEFWRDTGRPPF